MAGILQFCNSFISMIYNFGKWCLDGFIECLQYAVYWIFDGFYTLVLVLISTLDFGSLLVNLTSGWGLLPSQVIYCIDQISLGSALSMIGIALTIRVCLNIIPGVITRI